QISAWALMSVEEQWAVIDELDVQRRSNDVTIAPDFGD
ncbi:MAG: hypothetical protein ACI89J_004617, partial [Hyphomicrobiaceae bacterium]